MKKNFQLRKITQIMGCYIFIFISSSLCSESCDKGLALITYTSQEMEEHKKSCKERMISNPGNHQDPSYQLPRAIRTVSGNDADYIPKVPGAGEIFMTKDGLQYQLMHNGIKIIQNSYYDVQWITDVIYGLMGHHEPQEEKCFYEILKYIPDQATMIELGSYWAYYSLWFASKIQGAQNYLIEPDTKRIEIGKKNFMLNNQSGDFIRGFVGAMIEPTSDIWGAEYISIDKFIEEKKIKHVHVLHADVQGGEYEMLLSAVEHIDIIDYFFISTHGDSLHLSCLNFFKEHNCVIVAEHAMSESCSGDGLIVAKRKDVIGPDEISIKKY